MKKGIFYVGGTILGFIMTLMACLTTREMPILIPPTLLSPTNGATITANPPIFIWNTIDEDRIAYRLDVATDSAFTDTCICILISIWPPDTQYVPDTAFAPGTYYWHMCTREDC